MAESPPPMTTTVPDTDSTAPDFSPARNREQPTTGAPGAISTPLIRSADRPAPTNTASYSLDSFPVISSAATGLL